MIHIQWPCRKECRFGFARGQGFEIEAEVARKWDPVDGRNPARICNLSIRFHVYNNGWCRISSINSMTPISVNVFYIFFKIGYTNEQLCFTPTNLF